MPNSDSKSADDIFNNLLNWFNGLKRKEGWLGRKAVISGSLLTVSSKSDGVVMKEDDDESEKSGKRYSFPCR